MVRTLLLSVVVVLSGAAGQSAAPAPPPDLAGSYRCSGVNPDGSPYEAVVEITKMDGTFRVEWVMDGGSVLGVGIYSGGVFAASYFGGAPAIVVYKVDGDRLIGEWTMGGIEGAVYTETLTKMAPGERKPPPAPRRRQPDRETGPVRGIRL
jgi:hypothetical protein